jgi:spermidine/putrescine-binding protein
MNRVIVERAFKALDKIKPSVSHWITATPQTISLIQRNECDFTYAYNGRVFAVAAMTELDSDDPMPERRSADVLSFWRLAVWVCADWPLGRQPNA